jgi:hypothetical protein
MSESVTDDGFRRHLAIVAVRFRDFASGTRFAMTPRSAHRRR